MGRNKEGSLKKLTNLETTDNGTIVRILPTLNTVWLVQPNGLKIKITAKPDCWEVVTFGRIELKKEA
jgi:hypothetical protein